MQEGVRRIYQPEERERVVELAKKVGVKKAAYYLSVPASTIYHWMSSPDDPAPGKTEEETLEENRVYLTEKLWTATNVAVNELRKTLVDLKSAVELLTETVVDAAAVANTTHLEIDAPTLICAEEKR